MKTLRYRAGGSVKPGILDGEKKVRDASSLVHDWDSSTVTIEKLESIKSVDFPESNVLVKFIYKFFLKALFICEKLLGKNILQTITAIKKVSN